MAITINVQRIPRWLWFIFLYLLSLSTVSGFALLTRFIMHGLYT